jgi:hypothetical protein
MLSNTMEQISRQQAAGSRQQAAGSRQQAAGSRQQAAGSRQQNVTARFEIEPDGIRCFVLCFDCSVRVKRQELTTDD